MPTDSKGANSSKTRASNRGLVKRLVYRRGPISRQELVEATGLASSAITNITGELVSEGVLSEVGREQVSSGPGRSRVLLDVDADRNGVIAVNLSREFMEGAIVNARGRILHEISQSLDPADHEEPERVLTQVGSVNRELLARAAEIDLRVHGVGLGCPGFIDPGRNLIITSSTLQWRMVEVTERTLQVPDGMRLCVSINVKAMALAEQWFGNSSFEGSSLALIYVGYGIGSASIIDGRVYLGHRFRAGDFGHLPVPNATGRCYCGRIGCLETVSSMRAVLSRIRKEHRDRGDAGGSYDSEIWDEDLITRLVNQEDQIALRALEDAGYELGRAAFSVCQLIDPRHIILSGNVIDERSRLLSGFRRGLDEHFPDGNPYEVVLSSFGRDEGVIGAAAAPLMECFYNEM